jgi:hypothetical protein
VPSSMPTCMSTIMIASTSARPPWSMKRPDGVPSWGIETTCSPGAGRHCDPEGGRQAMSDRKEQATRLNGSPGREGAGNRSRLNACFWDHQIRRHMADLGSNSAV